MPHPRPWCVRAEAIAEDTIQLTLQLDEPGTLWCAALDTIDSDYCGADLESNELSSSESDEVLGTSPCYFETYIKGGTSDSTVFRSDVHVAYQDVKISVNRIWEKDRSGAAALTHETAYHIFCFAEDDWKIEAEAVPNSPNFAAPAGPNKNTITQVYG